jgi:hypothetical protein
MPPMFDLPSFMVLVALVYIALWWADRLDL